jgi:hypothetical protein
LIKSQNMRDTLKSVLYYDTLKLVTVHSLSLGAVHRFLQLAAVLYIFIYSVWLEKGYQGTSQISGVIYIKAKGSGYVNVTGGGEVYYDANDLVQPPVESDALFITTAFIETQQTRA